MWLSLSSYGKYFSPFFGSVFRDPFLPGIHQPPFETLTRLYSDTSARTDPPPARTPMRDARPPLGTSRSFEDVPLGPLCDGARWSNASSGVSSCAVGA